MRETLTIITWNVAGRIQRLGEQAEALATRSPDVVALQEVTPNTRERWRFELEAVGLAHVAEAPAPGGRRLGLLVAAREPLAVIDPPAVERPESALAVRLPAFDLLVAHVPNAANGFVKAATLAALRSALATWERPKVLCGDLNTPRREFPDGTVWSFARDGRGRMRPGRAGAWDAAELGVVPGLADLGMADCFRALHGYGSREPSWTWRRWGGGYRLDHVFASAELRPAAATYHHAWRERGLSDHSALEARLEGDGPSSRPLSA